MMCSTTTGEKSHRMEIGDAHHYMQRILEDLYGDRPTVEKVLIAKGKLTPPAAASTP